MTMPTAGCMTTTTPVTKPNPMIIPMKRAWARNKFHCFFGDNAINVCRKRLAGPVMDENR
jgi:hypothetical protein